MRVLAHVPAHFLEAVSGEFPDVEFVPVPLDGPVPGDLWGDVLFTWSRGAKNLAQVLEREVRWIHIVGTGVDEFPLGLVGERILTCARGAAAYPISEWVMAMMLAYEKRIPEQWIAEPSAEFLFGELGSLRGRRLGLIGFGTIGQQVARHAQGFGMEVQAMRRTPGPSPFVGVSLKSDVNELVAHCDHVVLAAPATPATFHMIGPDAFASMKPGVHLVNIARGSLIDQDALRVALDNGTVARATLDTTTPEPLPAGHWLYTHSCVRISPHVSWSTPGALQVTLGKFAINLRHWCAGEPLEGVVDVRAGY